MKDTYNPKLSVIATARNDDYGRNMLNRFGTFVKVLSLLADKYKMTTELVLVEYNPMPDKKYLAEDAGIKSSAYLKVRTIIVPREFHDRVRGDNNAPYLEYIAKNIGVRRARGEYILVTNPDILLSEPLFAFISKDGGLKKDLFYRVNRHDILTRVFGPELSLKQIYKICERNLEKILYNKILIYKSWLSWTNRFIRTRNRKTMRMFPLLDFFVKPSRTEIHDMGAGDFLLAHRDLWEKATGYDETPLCSYMDGYILHLLKCLGYQQEILDYPIYHINHDIGKGGRPKVTPEEYIANVEKMEKTGIPYRLNSSDWGFAKENFTEIEA